MKVISLARPTSLEEVKKAIRSAYSTPDGCAVTLSSVHRAKGLEFDTVVHLDPWRIPSMFAITDEDRKQEMNILNVVETRSKDFLILASINMFQGE
jgi:superfamily I DNA/RNA helicase